MTLKSRLRVTQGHCKRNHWIDHTQLKVLFSLAKMFVFKPLPVWLLLLPDYDSTSIYWRLRAGSRPVRRRANSHSKSLVFTRWRRTSYSELVVLATVVDEEADIAQVQLEMCTKRRQLYYSPPLPALLFRYIGELFYCSVRSFSSKGGVSIEGMQIYTMLMKCVLDLDLDSNCQTPTDITSDVCSLPRLRIQPVVTLQATDYGCWLHLTIIIIIYFVEAATY